MILNERRYKDKLKACFIGKNIGGTVGAPMEFHRRTNEIEGYTQTFSEPMPNDDLDIQLLWLICMEEKGINPSAELLCEYWQRYVTPHWAEYGIAKVNMKSGVLPPYSGMNNNPYFKNSNGAFIRSEIWACLAPGRPDVAVSYAVRDAVIDHGNGEGVWGEVFCAAMQSLCFVRDDPQEIIEEALRFIPEDCGLAKAVRDAVACHRQGMSLREARTHMLTRHRGHAALGMPIAKEDLEAGFDSGPYGYDCPLNVAIVVMGLLYGGKDYDRLIKSTIYFGEDTDCTVGTAASTFGLLYGTEALQEKWTAPIGDRIKTGCLNLGELGVYGSVLPQTVDELVDRVYRQHCLVALTYGLPQANEEGFDGRNVQYGDVETVKEHLRTAANHIVYQFPFYSVLVRYPDGCAIRGGQGLKVVLTFLNTYKTADILNLRWLLPEGMTVNPAPQGCLFLSHGGFYGAQKSLELEFLAEKVPDVCRPVLEISIDGRTTLMYVPIRLYSGEYTPKSTDEECFE